MNVGRFSRSRQNAYTSCAGLRMVVVAVNSMGLSSGLRALRVPTAFLPNQRRSSYPSTAGEVAGPAPRNDGIAAGGGPRRARLHKWRYWPAATRTKYVLRISAHV